MKRTSTTTAVPPTTPTFPTVPAAVRREIDAVISFIRKEFGEDSIVRLSEREEQAERLVTGLAPLDALLGGGLPRAKVVQIVGGESVGKSTLINYWARCAQLAGDLVNFIDGEQSEEKDRAEAIGVNPELITLSEPDTLEHAFGIAGKLIEHYGKLERSSFIMLDSLAAFQMQADIERPFDEEGRRAARAAFLSLNLPKLISPMKGTKIGLVFVNQLREKANAKPYEIPTYSPGGRAPRHWSHLILELKNTGQLKKGTEIVGMKSLVRVKKSKLTGIRPGAQTALNLYFTGKIEAAEGEEE